MLNEKGDGKSMFLTGAAAAGIVKFSMKMYDKSTCKFRMKHFCVLNEYGILPYCSVGNIIQTITNYHHVIYSNEFT